MDEFGPLNLQPRHGTCLAGKGKRVERHRATYSRKGGVRHFLAAYDLETDRVFGLFRRRKTGAEFLGFLKWLRYRYPSGQVLHIKPFSDAYFKVLELQPDLREPFSVGDRVIVAGRSMAIELTATGVESLTDRDLAMLRDRW